MTAETQVYHQQYSLPTDMKCFRQQEQYQNHSGVRPSTLLKLSEHIRSKRYSLNLLRETTKDGRTKRKIAPYASAFRPSLPSSLPSSPAVAPVTVKQEPKSIYNPLPIKPVPEQRMYYLSGLELLSYVSCAQDRLEVPPRQEIKQESR